MELDQQKEQFSLAYVQAVAAVAGFAWSKPSVDDDSVDLTLHQRGGGGTIRSPRLDLQLKCKAAATPSETAFSHSIKLKNYDDLRDPSVQVPRILVLVLVPDELGDWLAHSEAEMALRRCAYWVSLRGLPESGNDTGQTVTMLKTQHFHAAALREIMSRIASGGQP